MDPGCIQVKTPEQEKAEEEEAARKAEEEAARLAQEQASQRARWLLMQVGATFAVAFQGDSCYCKQVLAQLYP